MKMKNMMAFGDSVLKGVINDDGHYHISKSSFTKSCENIYGIKIENLAKMGSTITLGKDVLFRSIDKIKESDCDYVLLEFGGNDCDFSWDKISENPNLEYTPHSKLDDFKKCYLSLIYTIKSLGKKPILLSLPPIDPNKYFNWITRNLNKENILKFLGGNIQYLADFHEMYNLEVFKIAMESGSKIIDITSNFLKKNNYTDYLCMDGIHPNQKGHNLILESIKESFA